MSSIEVLVESEQVKAFPTKVFATPLACDAQIRAAITKTPARASVVPAKIIPTAEDASRNHGVE